MCVDHKNDVFFNKVFDRIIKKQPNACTVSPWYLYWRLGNDNTRLFVEWLKNKGMQNVRLDAQGLYFEVA